MKMDLKSPCKECPFLKGSLTNVSLADGRLDGIVKDIRNDMSFTCHKSLKQKKQDQQHCAGAMIFLEKENNPNQIMRIAERLNLYDRHELVMKADIINSK